MKIPTPAELHPRTAELEIKRNKLYAEKTAKVAEAAIIRARIQESPSNGNAAENRVRAILGESLLADTAPDMPRLEVLLRELNDINSALGILSGAIEKEKAIASRLVCEAVKPEVTKRAKAFAAALLSLYEAQVDYHTYLDQIQDTGASTSSLPRIFINGLGDAKDRSGQYMYAMKDFIEAGYLDRSQMPKAIR